MAPTIGWALPSSIPPHAAEETFGAVINRIAAVTNLTFLKAVNTT